MNDMPKELKKIRPLLLISAMFVFSCLIVSGFNWYLYFRPAKISTVTVTGTSSSKVRNQIAQYSLSVEANNPDKQAAVTEVNTKAKNIVDELKKFGIPEDDLKTTNFNVYQREEPILEGGVQKFKPGNWYANYTINVTLRDLSKSDDLTSLLNSFDKSSLWGPNLQVDDKKIDEGSLLEEAYKDAKAKALRVAKASGKSLGETVDVTESNGGSVVPFYAKADAVGFGGGGGGATPIVPGTTETEKTVIVTFKLN